MIKRYTEMSTILHPILTSIKRWAKAYGLVDASQSKFSSYSLVLMTIALFQSWKLLPNLQHLPLPALGTESAYWFRDRRDERIRCDIRYHKMLNWKPSVQIPERIALQKWFGYWALAHRYGKDAACIRLGGIIPINSVLTDKPFDPYEENVPSLKSEEENVNCGAPAELGLVVMDPFLIHKNTTIQLSPNVLKEFRNECANALTRLKKGDSLIPQSRKRSKRENTHHEPFDAVRTAGTKITGERARGRSRPPGQ